MNRQQAYNRVYQNLLEQGKKGFLTRAKDFLTPSAEYMNKSELGAAGLGLGSTVATFTPVAPAGVAGELAASVWDLKNAGLRALRGEYGDAALNLLSAIPYAGTAVGAGKLGKAALTASDIASDVEKAGDVSKAVKVGTAGVETGKEIVPYVAKTGVKTGKEIVPYVAKTGKELAPIALKVGKEAAPIAAKAPSALSRLAKVGGIAGTIGTAGLLASSLMDGEEDEGGLGPDEIPVQAGEPGLYKLGSFSSQASGYAKSVRPSTSREFSAPGYHPFFTMPSDVATEYRRRDINLPESKDYNLDNVYYRRAYKAVNKYLNSPHGKELNNHLNSIRSTIE